MSKNSVKRDVRLQVAPGPLACSFEPDYNGCAAVIKGFSLTPAGLESPLAKRVKRGYVLVAIDDTVLTRMKRRGQNSADAGEGWCAGCASTRVENARWLLLVDHIARLVPHSCAWEDFRAVVFLLRSSSAPVIHSPKCVMSPNASTTLNTPRPIPQNNESPPYSPVPEWLGPLLQ